MKTELNLNKIIRMISEANQASGKEAKELLNKAQEITRNLKGEVAYLKVK